MSTTPFTARFDGKVLVPEEPLDASPGDVFEIGPKRSSMSEEEWLAFLESAEGAWVGSKVREPHERKPLTPEEWKAYVRRTAGAWGDFDFVEPEELPYEDEEAGD